MRKLTLFLVGWMLGLHPVFSGETGDFSAQAVGPFRLEGRGGFPALFDARNRSGVRAAGGTETSALCLSFKQEAVLSGVEVIPGKPAATGGRWDFSVWDDGAQAWRSVASLAAAPPAASKSAWAEPPPPARALRIALPASAGGVAGLRLWVEDAGGRRALRCDPAPPAEMTEAAFDPATDAASGVSHDWALGGLQFGGGTWIVAGHANTQFRKDRALARFDLTDWVMGPPPKRVELSFMAQLLGGRTRVIRLEVLPYDVERLTPADLHGAAAPLAWLAIDLGAVRADHVLDVSDCVRKTLMAGRGNVTFRFVDPFAERNGNPENAANGVSIRTDTLKLRMAP